MDGSIYRFTFPEDEGGAGMSSVQLVSHSCVPYALGWGASVGAAGNDNRVRGQQRDFYALTPTWDV